jgi:glyoxylase-like metal-dependent hydrolase (beta-lactamase superfamily II)
MTYTGTVRTGGPPDVRQTTDLIIAKVSVGTIDNNAYVLTCRHTGERLLIDAAAAAPTLLALAEAGPGLGPGAGVDSDRGPAGPARPAGGASAEIQVGTDVPGGELAAVVTTHRHWDHWGALADVVAATGARTFAGRDDIEGIHVPTDVAVDDGDVIRVGAVELTAHHLVGHSPGSIALLYRDPAGFGHLFSGDCLFPGGVGNTERDPRRFASLIDDVETKIFGVLPDDTWVYPGHGKDTTIGAERPNLAQWRARGW